MTSCGAITSQLRSNGRRARVVARRRWIARLLPLALLALIIQVLAPVAASAMSAATIATADPLAGAVICHADPDAAPSNRDADRTDCSLDCQMCCALHDATALHAPPIPVEMLHLRGWTRVEWSGPAPWLIHLVPWSHAQPRGPPVLS